MAVGKPGSETSPGTELASTLVCCLRHPVHDILLQQSEQTNTLPFYAVTSFLLPTVPARSLAYSWLNVVIVGTLFLNLHETLLVFYHYNACYMFLLDTLYQVKEDSFNSYFAKVVKFNSLLYLYLLRWAYDFSALTILICKIISIDLYVPILYQCINIYFIHIFLVSCSSVQVRLLNLCLLVRLFCNFIFSSSSCWFWCQSYSYLAKWVGGVLSLSLFSRLNKTGIIYSPKLWYNSFVKLSGPVMRRFGITDSISLIVKGIF